jgi:hypothetical protein
MRAANLALSSLCTVEEFTVIHVEKVGQVSQPSGTIYKRQDFGPLGYPDLFLPTCCRCRRETVALEHTL